jgi:zinc protease
MTKGERHPASGLRGFLFALGLFVCSPAAQASVFQPDVFTLGNGLKVVIVHNKLADAVAQMVWYKVGAVDDPAGQSGSAHFLEHMMFKGTESRGDGAFSKTIAQLGGQDNAYTTHDTTAYHVTISAANLPLAMALEAERMRRLTFDPQMTLTERDVILSERQQRTENTPEGLFFEKLRKTFYGEYPYGRPVIGWGSDVAKITDSELRTFYDRYYGPSNAILVISGNVETRDVLRLAAGTFGRLPPSAARFSVRLKDKMAVPAQKELILHDARVRQPFWIRQIIAPREHGAAAKAAALDVLSELLSGGEVGLLYRHFVMDLSRASAITASYDGARRGEGVFSLSAVPAATLSPQTLAQEVDAYLAGIAKKGIQEKDVVAAKKRLLRAAIFARDRLMAPAQVLGGALAVGLPLSAVENWPAQIEGVTSRDVIAALRALVAERRTISGFLLGQEEAAP